MNWWGLYITALGGTAVLAALCTWLARLAGRHLEILDQPEREAHKKHSHPIPLLGGPAMYAAWILVTVGGFLLLPKLAPILSLHIIEYIPNLRLILPRFLIIAWGGTAFLLLGLLDDARPLGAFPKLAAQAGVALLVSIYGVRITVFVSHPLLTCLLTAAWIVVIVNSINFFDNMDGLAAGTTAVAAIIFMLGAGIREQYFVAAMAASIGGIALGFLVFNWPAASIFMGDAGSHLLGYLLAVTGALATYFQAGMGMSRISVLIPLLVLAVPIYDFFTVILIRLLEKRPIYHGDHSHISHRFLAMGLSEGATLVLILLLNVIIGSGALTLFWLPPHATVIVLMQAISLVIFITILHAARLRI